MAFFINSYMRLQEYLWKVRNIQPDFWLFFQFFVVAVVFFYLLLNGLLLKKGPMLLFAITLIMQCAFFTPEEYYPIKTYRGFTLTSRFYTVLVFMGYIFFILQGAPKAFCGQEEDALSPLGLREGQPLFNSSTQAISETAPRALLIVSTTVAAGLASGITHTVLPSHGIARVTSSVLRNIWSGGTAQTETRGEHIYDGGMVNLEHAGVAGFLAGVFSCCFTRPLPSNELPASIPTPEATLRQPGSPINNGGNAAEDPAMVEAYREATARFNLQSEARGVDLRVYTRAETGSMSDAYQRGVDISSQHTIDEWLRIQAGTLSINHRDPQGLAPRRQGIDQSYDELMLSPRNTSISMEGGLPSTSHQRGIIETLFSGESKID